MNPALLSQWQRLIFPPVGVAVRAGEQLREGNRYPDVQGCPDWQAHQDGRRTYAVNPAYPDPDGETDLCKFAVLDIDEGADSLPKARALLALCDVAGLAAPAGLVRAVLKRLKAAIPFQGELIPGDLTRAKIPPAFHQERRLWAFFLETLPDPGAENRPYGVPGRSSGHSHGRCPYGCPRAGGLCQCRRRTAGTATGNRYGSRPGKTG